MLIKSAPKRTIIVAKPKNAFLRIGNPDVYFKDQVYIGIILVRHRKKKSSRDRKFKK